MPIIIKTPDDRLAYLIGRFLMEREALVSEIDKLKEKLAEYDKKPTSENGG